MDKTKLVNVMLLCYLAVVTAVMDNSRDITRLGCNTKKDYDFLTEYNRLPENRYVAEYKRIPEYRYSFGIGKRWFDDSSTKRNSPYSFGLGKRLVAKMHPLRFFTGLSTNDNKYNNYMTSDDGVDDFGIKRGAPSRSYDFGIGKRFSDEDRHLHKDNNIDDNDQIINSHDQNKDHLDGYNTNNLNSNEDHTWEQY